MEPPAALSNLTNISEHAAASACFGAPVSAGDRIVIPVAEVWYGLAFGWGGGEMEKDGEESEGGGGGGGGGSRVRGVSVIEVAPDGVRVHPILDQTAVALAGIAFASAGAAIMSRMLLKLVRG